MSTVLADGADAQQRFTLIDALRGLSALSVLLFHAFEGDHITGLLAQLPTAATAVLELGNLGVAVFFVLSGFVIAHSLSGRRVTMTVVGRFMLRRSVRLEPPYWIAIMLAIAFGYLAARFVPGREAPSFSAEQVSAHVLYLQDILGYPQINVVFWTLCQEVQFYLVYVLLLALSHNDPALQNDGPATALALAAAAVTSLLWPLGILVQEPWRGSFLPLWHCFLVGAGAYWAWRHPQMRPYFLLYALLLLTASALRANGFTLICALTALGLWVAAISGRIYTLLDWRWVQVLGMVSYSLYLTHNPITGATFRVGYTLTGRSPALEAVWWLLATACCIAFACLVWALVERPSIKLARSIRLQRAAAV